MNISVVNKISLRIHTKECALAKTMGMVGGTLRRRGKNTWGKIGVHGRA